MSSKILPDCSNVLAINNVSRKPARSARQLSDAMKTIEKCQREPNCSYRESTDESWDGESSEYEGVTLESMINRWQVNKMPRQQPETAFSGGTPSKLDHILDTFNNYSPVSTMSLMRIVIA